MKKAVVVAVVVVSLFAASVAVASHLSMHFAKNEAFHFAKGQCHSIGSCRFYGEVGCDRISGRRVDCKNFLEFKHSRRPRKTTCTQWVHVTRNNVRIEHGSTKCVKGWR